MSHILFYYHWATHGSPRYYHEAFEALGHEVTWCGTSSAWGHPGYAADVDVAAVFTHLASEGRPPDAFIYCGGGGVPRGIHRLPIPTATFFGDLHFKIKPWQGHFARLFDVVFAEQRDFMEPFRAYGARRVHWLPCAADPSLFDPRTEREIDVAIVGQMNEKYSYRARLLADLSQHFAVEWRTGVSREAMADLYSRSKIVFNASAGFDLTMRPFEGMAAGALVVTDRIANGLDEFFSDGQDIVLYDRERPDDLVQKVGYYLDHDSERQTIAARGLQLVREHHTYLVRAQMALDMMQRARDSDSLMHDRQTLPRWYIAHLYALGWHFMGGGPGDATMAAEAVRMAPWRPANWLLGARAAKDVLRSLVQPTALAGGLNS